MKKPERIYEILQKLKTMSENGATDGERQAAQNRLNFLCKKYSIRIEELESDNKFVYSFHLTHKFSEQILAGILVSYLNRKYDALRKGKLVVVFLTCREYIDCDVAYNYYQDAFQCDSISLKNRHKKSRQRLNKRIKKESSILLLGFINKHKLFDEESLKNRDKPSKKDTKKIIEINRAIENIQSDTLRKPIELLKEENQLLLK